MNYFWRSKPVDVLTRDELRVALKQCIDDLQQARRVAADDSEMETMFRETERAIRQGMIR